MDVCWCKPWWKQCRAPSGVSNSSTWDLAEGQQKWLEISPYRAVHFSDDMKIWKRLVPSTSVGFGLTTLPVMGSRPNSRSRQTRRKESCNLTKSCGLIEKSRALFACGPVWVTNDERICTTRCPSDALKQDPAASAARYIGAVSQWGGGIMRPTTEGPVGSTRTSGNFGNDAICLKSPRTINNLYHGTMDLCQDFDSNLPRFRRLKEWEN